MNNKQVSIGGHIFPPSDVLEKMFVEVYPSYKDKEYPLQQAGLLGYTLARYDMLLHYLNQTLDDVETSGKLIASLNNRIVDLNSIIAELTENIKEYDNVESNTIES